MRWLKVGKQGQKTRWNPLLLTFFLTDSSSVPVCSAFVERLLEFENSTAFLVFRMNFLDVFRSVSAERPFGYSGQLRQDFRQKNN
jgi:hypothetical protein